MNICIQLCQVSLQWLFLFYMSTPICPHPQIQSNFKRFYQADANPFNKYSSNRLSKPFISSLCQYLVQFSLKMKSKGLVVFLIIALLVLAQCRGGRGGGGSGGGGHGGGGGGGKGNGGGGGSGGGGSRGGAHSYENCRRNCQSRGDYSQNCVDRCANGGMGMSFLFFLFLCCCGVPLFLCTCCGRCLPKQTEEEARRSSGNHNHQNSQYQPSNIYETMVSLHNHPQYDVINAPDFEAACNMFQTLVDKSKVEPTFIIHTDEGDMRVQASPYISNARPFLKQISMTGSDRIGSFSSRGAIVCRAAGMFVWFVKEYNDRDAAGQTDEWRDLVFESDYYQPDGIRGRWYYRGFEMDPEYSGRWQLQPSEIPMNIYPYIQANTQGNDINRPLLY